MTPQHDPIMPLTGCSIELRDALLEIENQRESTFTHLSHVFFFTFAWVNLRRGILESSVGRE